MKKLYISLLCILLAVLMGFGIASLVCPSGGYSEMENRALAKKPQFTWNGLLDGSYIAAFETYYSDSFPLREQFLKLSRTLNKFYYFSGGDEQSSMLIIDGTSGAESGGETLEEITVPPPAAETPPETEPAVEEQPPAPKIDVPDESAASYAGNVVIVGTRAMEVPTASEEIITKYAEAVNHLSEAMPGVRTVSLVTPNSGEFYSPESMHTGPHSQKDMIAFCYDRMNDTIVKVNAYDAIAQHVDEYIYFRTDHHWTQLGAYYAYTAFCDALGLEAVPLEDFGTGVYENFVGSMYTFTSGYPQSQLLKDNPDTLTYYLPLMECKARYYSDTTLQDGIPISVVYTKLQNTDNKYLCYIGGDTPVCVIETDGLGGTCLVLKESYGNAFVPFLTSHYSRIIVIDPREFNQPGKPALALADFAAEQNVDDLLVINYPYMINSSNYVNWLDRLVGKDESWDP